MRVSTVAIVLCLAVVAVYARSDGRVSCSSDVGRYATTKYGKGSVNMPWVAAPVRSKAYWVRHDEGLSTYSPGQVVPIRVGVSDIDDLHVGLVMYATQAGKSARVGKWLAHKGDTHSPHCDGTMIAHTDADTKALETVYYFVAPPKGTGRIIFRIMLKHGEQSTGKFFWPYWDRYLTEAAPVTRPKYFIGGGSNCGNVCNYWGLGATCNAGALATVNTAAKMEDIVTKIGRGCKLPLVASCDRDAPKIDADDYCSFKSSKCADGANAPSSGCNWTPPSGERRLCACSGGSVRAGADALNADTFEIPEDAETPTEQEEEANAPFFASTSNTLLIAGSVGACFVFAGAAVAVTMRRRTLATPANAGAYVSKTTGDDMPALQYPASQYEPPVAMPPPPPGSHHGPTSPGYAAPMAPPSGNGDARY